MDTATPAEACNIARALGIEAPALDVNSACTSFFAQLHVLSLMRAEALPPWVLLVVSEAVTRAVDYNDRASAVSGATAASRRSSRRRIPARARIVSTSLASSPEGADRVVVPRTGHFRQDGRVVQMFAIRKTAQLWSISGARTRRRGGGSTSSATRPTCACSRPSAASAACPTTAPRERTGVRQHRGRGRAVGAVDALGRVADGDDVAVCGVGAGLTWASYLLRFEGPAQ
jgi:3-oxoacyl-[acyl-carrier-protein] synthase-3